MCTFVVSTLLGVRTQKRTHSRLTAASVRRQSEQKMTSNKKLSTKKGTRTRTFGYTLSLTFTTWKSFCHIGGYESWLSANLCVFSSFSLRHSLRLSIEQCPQIFLNHIPSNNPASTCLFTFSLFRLHFQEILIPADWKQRSHITLSTHNLVFSLPSKNHEILSHRNSFFFLLFSRSECLWGPERFKSECRHVLIKIHRYQDYLPSVVSLIVEGIKVFPSTFSTELSNSSQKLRKIIIISVLHLPVKIFVCLLQVDVRNSDVFWEWNQPQSVWDCNFIRNDKNRHFSRSIFDILIFSFPDEMTTLWRHVFLGISNISGSLRHRHANSQPAVKMWFRQNLFDFGRERKRERTDVEWFLIHFLFVWYNLTSRMSQIHRIHG